MIEIALQCSTGNFIAPSLTEAGISTTLPRIQATTPATVLFSSPARQPITDVNGYLERRRACAHYEQEDNLWITVPAVERENVTLLLAAIGRVKERAKFMSITRACAEVLAQDRFAGRHWSAKRFRTQCDDYIKTKDWVCLVNRSKCNVAWRKTSVGLPDVFLNFVAKHYLARYARMDGKRQAITALHRHWRTGRNQFGEEQVIEGYEKNWSARIRELIPDGWTYGNIMRQIKARAKFQRAEQAMLHDSTAAATQYMPQIMRSRAGMLFLQEVTFDDVRFDYLIVNKDTGEQEELWALVARDTATGMVLGGVLYPASERADGTVTHLGAKQMKELCGQLLELWPLPPYPVNWKVERGTATIAAGVKAALGELFGNRIVVSYTSMIGGKSPVGYAEKKKGNSRGKASHESHNRLFHTAGSFIPGQIGNSYGVRPSDLKARCEEAQQIVEDGRKLPEHLRDQLKYTLLTLAEARMMFRELSLQQNFRTDHAMEDFAEVLEWFNPADQKIHPKSTAPNPLPPGARWMPMRRESPVERAACLIKAVDDWMHCSPAIIVAFLEHNEKFVDVNEKGEITFDHERKKITFINAGVPLSPGSKALAYYHADNPNYIHLTDGKGSVLGTWVRKGGVRFGDREGLSAAMRYTHTAQAAAAKRAKELAAPQRDDLTALRAHNARLAEFIEITEPPQATVKPTIGTPTGAALTAVSNAVKTDVKKAGKKSSAEAIAAAADIFKPARSPEKMVEETALDNSAAKELMAAFRKQSA